jgi:glycosyltransferase involved in cell wall biosynthesis
VTRYSNLARIVQPPVQIVVASAWPAAERLKELQTLSRQQFYLIQHDERLYHGNPAVVARTYSSSLKKIVVSTWLQEMLKRDFGQDSHLLLNSFDRDIFQPILTAKAGDGRIRVLLINHPYAWKGTAEGARMVQELKQKHPTLLLMGFGARGDRSPANFDEFHFSPPPTKLAALYSRADIFLCPSWDEGFGLPNLEAMACGTAVVTYDNGGSRDFVRDGETALVAPRRDYAGLKNRLERLIVDESLRLKIAAAGRRLAENWPTWTEQARKLEKILKSVITE